MCLADRPVRRGKDDRQICKYCRSNINEIDYEEGWRLKADNIRDDAMTCVMNKFVDMLVKYPSFIDLSKQDKHDSEYLNAVR